MYRELLEMTDTELEALQYRLERNYKLLRLAIAERKKQVEA